MAVEDQVTASLFQFLHSHVEEIKVEDIDEVVLSYVVNILQDLTSGSYMDEEAFDVDAFCETLFAYLPETSVISPIEITEWMFALAKEQRELKASEKRIQLDLKSVIEETTAKKPTASAVASNSKNRKTSEGSGVDDNQKKRVKGVSESSDQSDPDSEDFKQMVNQLLEMFPLSCALEVGHCLTVMTGDMERAAQLIIQRQEAGQSLHPSDRKNLKGKKTCDKVVDDKLIKERIMGKYGYVDQAEDSRYHRPNIKREDDKKMIRYRDGKIVSTKGERFTQVTKAESEEMKKSYVNNLPS